MKQLHLLLALLLGMALQNACHAQYHPMAIEGAHWVIFSRIPEDIPNHHLLSTEGDTTISGLTYKKIVRRSIASEAYDIADLIPPYEVLPTATLVGFLRDDTLARRTYAIGLAPGSLCNTGEEELLYDFSLWAGDTLAGCLFNEAGPGSNIIAGVTQEQIYGHTRQVYQMTDTQTEIIEGVGGYTGIFSENIVFIVDYAPALVDYCLGHFEDCGILVVSAQDIGGGEQIAVYPNPTSSEITIDLSSMKGELRSITMVNMLGQVSMRQEYKTGANNQPTLMVGPLDDGIYLLSLEMGDGKRLLKKIQIH